MSAAKVLKFETTGNDIFVETTNPLNQGRERVWRIDGKFYISSDWGSGFGAKQPMARNLLKVALSCEQVPQWVVDRLFDTETQDASDNSGLGIYIGERIDG